MPSQHGGVREACWASIQLHRLTVLRRCRSDNLDIQPGQHGVGNRDVPARLDGAAQGVGTEDKGLQEIR